MKLRFARKTRTFCAADRRHAIDTRAGEFVPLDGTYQSMLVGTRDAEFGAEFVVVRGQAYQMPTTASLTNKQGYGAFLDAATALIRERGRMAGLRVPKRESSFAHKAQAEEVAKLVAREMAWENRP